MNYYIKFEMPKRSGSVMKKKSILNIFLLKSFINMLKIFIPQANPDYDKKIEEVKFWLLEFNENPYPVREIGLDENQRSITKMPYKTNYGYWTDNELKLDDFKKLFSVESTNQDYFIEKWNELS